MKSDSGTIRRMRAAALALPALFFLAGCGGSGTIVAGGGTGGTGISAGVITGKGSVTVNGVRFAIDNTTTIRLNDIDASESDLQIGMFVKIRGTFADGAEGTAESIEGSGNVRGRISALDPGENSFSVLGQKSFVDNQTIFFGVGGFGDLQLSDIVRVFGFRDFPGDIRATFVERLSGSGEEEEVSGIVSEKDAIPGTFRLGFLLVDYVARNPEIDPPGFEFNNGDTVEVEGEFIVGLDIFEADKIESEDIKDAGFLPMEGEKVEVEGFASGVTEDPPGVFSFSVSGFPVATNAGTSYKGGAQADLRDNVRVEAEGVWIGGVVVAEEIEFK